MTLQPITYQGRTVAACTARRLFLCDELDQDPASPLAEFVFAMCLYAGQVLNGQLPGPYRDDDARAYARRLLIPAELLERARRCSPHELSATAEWLGVPADELRLAVRTVERENGDRPTAPRRARGACRRR